MERKMRKVFSIVIYFLLTVLLIGFIIPAFQGYTPPKKVVCSFHLHHLSVCFAIYHQEKKLWPNKDHWCDSIKSYIGDGEENIWFLCPEDEIGPCSYAMNKNIPNDANDLPPDLVLLFESAPGWNQTGGPEDVVTDRHKKTGPGTNIVFADGNVEFIPADKIPALRWTIKSSTSANISK